MMKFAVVYFRKDGFFIESESQTTAGVWIEISPVRRLSVEASDFEVGDSAYRALPGSQGNIEHPANWTGLLKPLLDLAGVTSWSAFSRSASCVSIESDGDGMRLIPHQFLGAKDGLEPLEAEAVRLPADLSAAELGRMIRLVVTRNRNAKQYPNL